MSQEVDQAALEQFMGQLIGTLTGGMMCFSILLGDELGLYRLMADTGKHHTSATCTIAAVLLTRIVACLRNGHRYELRAVDEARLSYNALPSSLDTRSRSAVGDMANVASVTRH